MSGSIINTLMANNGGRPTVGMGATQLFASDRHAATIVAVSASGRRVSIQRDVATRVDDNGMSESQVYTFEPDPTAPIEDYTLRKNGRWVRVGDSLRGSAIAIGHRSHFYDFSY